MWVVEGDTLCTIFFVMSKGLNDVSSRVSRECLKILPNQAVQKDDKIM